MKNVVIALLFILILAGCSKNVSIKYRDDKVNIGGENFEYLNTKDSSFVNGAWYDFEESYMVIQLSGTYYHYCGLPASEWKSFKNTESFGEYYTDNIKGRYDCRVYPVPEYNE